VRGCEVVDEEQLAGLENDVLLDVVEGGAVRPKVGTFILERGELEATQEPAYQGGSDVSSAKISMISMISMMRPRIPSTVRSVDPDEQNRHYRSLAGCLRPAASSGSRCA
jgi:hypothetical protein